MMKRTLFLILFLSTALFAYTDSDIDGVEDKYDKCPQTPLWDLVDMDGCVMQKVDEKLHYNLSVGSEFSNINNSSQAVSETVNTYVQANISLDAWRLELSASHYTSQSSGYSESGYNDTFLTLFYGVTPQEKLRVEVGAGLVLPSYVSGYANEAIDYSALINFQYNLNTKSYLFGGTTYTWVQDKNTVDVKYQNTTSAQIGAGIKPTQSIDMTLWYTNAQSIYSDVEAIQSLGIGMKFFATSRWSLGGAYMYGLSDSASTHTFSLDLGYSF